MTTYTEFYNNLKSLSIANIKTIYDSEPDFLEVSDLPAMWVQEPDGDENPITFQTHGGWPTLAAVVVIAIDSTSLMDRKRANVESLMFMDNLTDALRGAGNSIAKGRVTWGIRKGQATIADLEFWAVQAEVITHG
jgi:hypothetical protein